MNNKSGFDDFVAVVNELTSDFDHAYLCVSTDIEPVFFEVLSKRHGLTIKAVRSAWQGYLIRSRDRVWAEEEMSK